MVSHTVTPGINYQVKMNFLGSEECAIIKKGNYILLYSNFKKSRLFGTFVFSTVIY